MVELAMVLVVIGILMGGVLKGMEMITNTKLKKMQAQQAGTIAAMNLYYDRYTQYPGDDPAATSHFTALNGKPEYNGDGDGFIGTGDDWDMDESAPFVAGEQETLKFWSHLRAAGFVEGTYNKHSRPTHAMQDGKIGIQAGGLEIRYHVLVFGNLDGDMAWILDSRWDEGKADTGALQSAEITEDLEYSNAPATSYMPDLKYNLVWKLVGTNATN